MSHGTPRPDRMDAAPFFAATEAQLLEAQAMPKRATESVVASVLDMPVAVLRDLRRWNTGPECDITPDGQAIYTRTAVTAFLRAHMKA